MVQEAVDTNSNDITLTATSTGKTQRKVIKSLFVLMDPLQPAQSTYCEQTSCSFLSPLVGSDAHTIIKCITFS